MSEVPVVIQGFKGLNLREPAGMVQDDELVLCQNLDIGRAGELTKRTGFSSISTDFFFGFSGLVQDVKLLGHFKTVDHSQLMATTSEGKLFICGLDYAWESVKQNVVQHAMDDMVNVVGVLNSDWTYLGIEAVDWPNASLGCNDSGGIFQPTTTSGYRILFQHNTTLEYYYYSGKLGELPFRCLDPSWGVADFTADAGLILFGDVKPKANFAVQYVDKFYIVSNDDIYSWDGTDFVRLWDTPAGTFCIVYKDRLFLLSNTFANPNRIYFSAIADFEDWPSTNFFDVRPGDGDILTSCAIIQDLLLIFKTSSTWALYLQGSPQNWIIRNINPEIGNLSKNTPKEIEGFLYFVGLRGIYKTDGNIFDEISQSIQPIFTERVVDNSFVDEDAAAWWEDKYIVLLYPTNTRTEYRYMVYHLSTEGWTEWELGANVTPYTFVEIVSGDFPKGLYTGSRESEGHAYRHGQETYLDRGSQYTITLKSKDYDFSLPSLMKRGKWLALDTLIENSNGQIVYQVDGETLEPLNFEGRTIRGLYKIAGPGYFRVWNFQYSSTSTTPLIFYSATLWMHRKRSTIKAVT